MNIINNRRTFLIKSLLTTTGVVLLSTKTQASTKSDSVFSLNSEGNLFFTKDKPGRWSNKISGHEPVVKVTEANSKLIEVTTPHEMNGTEHYIIKHQLLDQDLNLIDENLFDPFRDKSPISQFTFAGKSKTIYVASLCNKHDLWIKSLAIN